MHIDVSVALHGKLHGLRIFEGEKQVENNCVFQCYELSSD